MGQKKRRKSKALTDLTEERDLDAVLHAIIFEAVRESRETGLFVIVPLPGQLLAKLAEIDRRRSRQNSEN
jgi:hypothetical protein